MDERDLVRGLCAGRAAIGSALLLSPSRAARAWTGEEPGPGLRMAARAVGGRDLALALGTLGALRRGTAIGSWLRAGAAADASDALGALAALGHLPRARRRFLVATPLSAAALGLCLAARMPSGS